MSGHSVTQWFMTKKITLTHFLSFCYWRHKPRNVLSLANHKKYQCMPKQTSELGRVELLEQFLYIHMSHLDHHHMNIAIKYDQLKTTTVLSQTHINQVIMNFVAFQEWPKHAHCLSQFAKENIAKDQVMLKMGEFSFSAFVLAKVK